MRRFHVTVHASPTQVESSEEIEIGGVKVLVLAVSPEVQQRSLSVTFDEAQRAMDQLPRLFLEGDGSFVWVGGENSPAAWQIDGQLCDGRDGLLHVELKGSCPLDRFKELLAIFHPDQAEFMFHLVHEGVWLDQHEFCRWAF